MAIVVTPQMQSLMNQINAGMANLQKNFAQYQAEQASKTPPAPTPQVLPPAPASTGGGGAYVNLQTQQSIPMGRPSPGYNAQGQPISGGSGSGSQLNTETSIVDYLKSIGQDSSLPARAELGKQYGIDYSKSTTNYAAENMQLLNALKSGGVSVGAGAGAGGTPLPPTPPDTTPTTPTTPPPPGFDPYALYRQELVKLQTQLQQPQKTLTPEEQALYDQMTKQTTDIYTQAMADLVRQQEQEKQRLVGRYAAMGFSEPGIISGEVGAPPGVVTKALQELGQAQQRDIAQMESQKALGLTAIQQAQAEALRRAQEQASQTYNQQLNTLMNALKDIMYPQIYSAGNQFYRYNPATGQIENVSPEDMVVQGIGKESFSTPQVADDGTVYMVDYSTTPPSLLVVGKVAKKADTVASDIQVKGDPIGGFKAFIIDKNTQKVIEIPIEKATPPKKGNVVTPDNSPYSSIYRQQQGL